MKTRQSSIIHHPSSILGPLLWVAGMITAAIVLGSLLMGVARAEVNSEVSAISYTGNGSTKTFTFPFGILATTQLRVVVRETATGAETPLTLNSDYSIADDDGDGDYTDGPGGSITTLAVAAYTSAYTIHLERSTALTQTRGIDNTRYVDLTVIEDAVDNLTYEVQYLRRMLYRVPLIPETEAQTTDMNLPNSIDRAGGTLTFDADGDPLVVAGVISPNDVNVTPSWAAVLEGDPNGAQRLNAKEDLGVDHVDVRDYGAVGDGTTDDGPAIQAANNAAELVGGVVLFPPGTYKIATSVTVDSSVRWEGSGIPILLLDGGDITVTGWAGDAEAITAAIARGDPNITVADANAYGATYLAFVSGHNSATYENANQAWWGEYHVVRGTSAGVIEFEDLIANKQDTTDYPGVYNVIPISFEMHNLRINCNNSANTLWWYYVKDGGMYDCMITGQHSGSNRIIEVIDCLNWKMQGCAIYDIVGSYPIRVVRSDGVVFNGNTITDSLAGLITYWSKNVTMTGNIARRVHISALSVWDAFNATISGNAISNMPDSITDYETSSTGCSGIQIYGGENVSITGNALYACHGEGGIYLRVSSYDYDDGSDKPPLCNISVVGNTIIDPPATAESAANHLGGLYAKTKGSDIVVADNTFVFYSRTAASAAIHFSGAFDRVTVTNNRVRSQHAGIAFTNNTGTLYPLGFSLLDNGIDLLADLTSETYGAIRCGTIENGAAYDRVIKGNRITGVAQTGSQYHITVNYSTTAWVAGSRLVIEDNTARFASDAAGRGVSVNITSGTPSAGDIRVQGNDFDLGGSLYSTWIQRFLRDGMGQFIYPTAKTASYAVLAADDGRSFTSAKAVTFKLCPAVVGMTFRFTQTDTNDLTIDPNGSELFYGNAAGHALRLDDQGCTVTIRCLETGKWAVVAGYDPNMTDHIPFKPE